MLFIVIIMTTTAMSKDGDAYALVADYEDEGEN
jgi:hypothetical protein